MGMAIMRSMPKAFATLLFALYSAAPLAASDSSYLSELRAQARELRLHQKVQWHSLLHYRANSLLAGVTSEVESGNFFVAPDGKTNPAAELDATLASFFSEQQRDGEPTQCRAKARYQWLKTMLRFDAQRLPEQACERMDAWFAAIDPHQLSMVFASNDLSGAATTFGHTLMRLERHGLEQKAYAINYSAVYDQEENALSYAIRGVTGGYAGVFAIAPYEEKVNEYAHIENRDLWEYPLLLSSDDLRRLLWHLWELRDVEFTYYFFYKNCSYQLLSLIDAARPDLQVLAPFPSTLFPHVIPIDTIRALARKGIIGPPVYHPAPVRAAISDSSEPRPASPDQGHESRRVSVAVRSDRRGTALLLRSRDALHDLLDPPQGYLAGGELEFFDLGLLVNDNGVRVQELKLAGVKAAVPENLGSWFASFGGRRYGLDAHAAKPRGSLGFYGEGGGGITLAPIPNLQLFAYGETQFDANPSLRGSYSIAVGPRIGAALQWGGCWTQLTEAQWLTPVAGGGEHQVYVRGGVQWQWTPRFGLRASFNYGRSAGESLTGAEVLLNYYF